MALLGCAALWSCNDNDEPAIPTTLDGTRWVNVETVENGSVNVMMEFIDGTIARYTRQQKSNGDTTDDITQVGDKVTATGNVTYNYTYTYNSPNVVLTPITLSAPALTGRILGGEGGSYNIIELRTADGELFFTAFEDDGDYIWAPLP